MGLKSDCGNFIREKLLNSQLLICYETPMTQRFYGHARR